MQVIATVVADVIRRRPADRIVFNAAQLAISWAAAGLVLEAVGGTGLDNGEDLKAADLPGHRARRRRLLHRQLHARPHRRGAASGHIDRGPQQGRPRLPRLVRRHAVRARPPGRGDRDALALPRPAARAPDGRRASRGHAGVRDGAPGPARSADRPPEPRPPASGDRARAPQRERGRGAGPARVRPRPLPRRERHARPRPGRRRPEGGRRAARALGPRHRHGRARGGRPLRRAPAEPRPQRRRRARRRQPPGRAQLADGRGGRGAERGRHRRHRLRARARPERRPPPPARRGRDVPRQAGPVAARVLLARHRGGGAAAADPRDRAQARDRHARDHDALPAQARPRPAARDRGGGARALDRRGRGAGAAGHLRPARRAHRPRRAAHRAGARDQPPPTAAAG